MRFLAGGDSIVESLRIRPAFSRGVVASGPASAPLAKQTLKLSDGLLAWWVLNEARVVADVMPKSQLLAMGLDAKAKAMTLFGTEKAIATAKMLVDIHSKHQGDIQKRLHEREQLASKLQVEREKKLKAQGHRVEFGINKEVIGLVVGKSGKHIL